MAARGTPPKRGRTWVRMIESSRTSVVGRRLVVVRCHSVSQSPNSTRPRVGSVHEPSSLVVSMAARHRCASNLRTKLRDRSLRLVLGSEHARGSNGLGAVRYAPSGDDFHASSGIERDQVGLGDTDVRADLVVGDAPLMYEPTDEARRGAKAFGGLGHIE